MTGAQLGPLRAVLIDLDGTLLDTAPELAHAANHARAAFGLPPLPVERVAQFVGKGTDILVHRALTDDLDGRAGAADFARAKALFERSYHEINGSLALVFERVPDALALLRGAGLRLGCVTNKPRAFTMPLLERMGLLPSLDVVVAGDEVERRKPHPDLLLEACARLGVAPTEALLLGDSGNDAQAAHAAGMPCVLVETGYNEGKPVAALAHAPGVRGVFAHLHDAAQWVLDARPAARTAGA